MGALDFGAEGQTSLTLSTDTSLAIYSSTTPLSFTIEAWIWVQNPALGRPQPLFTRYPQTAIVQGNSRAEFLLQLQDNGNLNLFFGGGSADVNRLALNLDCGYNVIKPSTWTHVALVVVTSPDLVNPSSASVYINGQLECIWPGFDSANTTFDGTRQVMYTEPFIIAGYELPSSSGCNSTFLTFTGRMDEIRVWASARTAEQIASYWNVVIEDAPDDAVGIFHLDRTQSEIYHNYASDSSSVNAPATFEGQPSDTQPLFTTSGVVMTETAPAVNFQLAQLLLYVYAQSSSDSFAVQVDVSSLGPLEKLYLDAGASVPVTETTLISVQESG